MKAIVLEKYGGPEVLTISDQKKPNIGKDQVLVKVETAAINPLDCKLRQGQFKLLTAKKFPVVLGCDFAGTIIEKGKNVQHLKEGDAVFGSLSPMKGPGAYAQYLAINAQDLAKKPAAISYEQAASIPIAGLTALQALRSKGQIKKGMQVLVNGASGGVGHFAVQLAKHFGAEVTGVCSERNQEWVRDLGADRLIDYKKEDFVKDPNSKYDIIFDTIGVRSFGESKAVMKNNSTFVTTIVNTKRFVRRFLTSYSGRKLATIITKINVAEMEELAQLLAEDQLNIRLDKTYAFDQVVEAHRYSETGRVRGKIVLNNFWEREG